MTAAHKSWSRVIELVCGVTFAASAAIAHAQPPAAAKKAANAATTPTESQVRAPALLMEMAQHLASAQRFSVNVRADYDALQASGEKIQFGEVRKVTVSRPGRLRVDGERSDGARVLTAFTGKEIVLVDLESKVYATAPSRISSGISGSGCRSRRCS